MGETRRGAAVDELYASVTLDEFYEPRRGTQCKITRTNADYQLYIQTLLFAYLQ